MMGAVMPASCVKYADFMESTTASEHMDCAIVSASDTQVFKIPSCGKKRSRQVGSGLKFTLQAASAAAVIFV